jgi:hypothetical protein
MIALLRTVWTVSAASYAEANGINPADVERELGGYLTASINDLPALDATDGWARSLPTPGARLQADERLVIRVDWRIEVTASSWREARGIREGRMRRDLLEHLTEEVYNLPSLCETDATMTAIYQLDLRKVRRTLRPEDRA